MWWIRGEGNDGFGFASADALSTILWAEIQSDREERVCGVLTTLVHPSGTDPLVDWRVQARVSLPNRGWGRGGAVGGSEEEDEWAAGGDEDGGEVTERRVGEDSGDRGGAAPDGADEAGG